MPPVGVDPPEPDRASFYPPETARWLEQLLLTSRDPQGTPPQRIRVLPDRGVDAAFAWVQSLRSGYITRDHDARGDLKAQEAELRRRVERQLTRLPETDVRNSIAALRSWAELKADRAGPLLLSEMQEAVGEEPYNAYMRCLELAGTGVVGMLHYVVEWLRAENVAESDRVVVTVVRPSWAQMLAPVGDSDMPDRLLAKVGPTERGSDFAFELPLEDAYGVLFAKQPAVGEQWCAVLRGVQWRPTATFITDQPWLPPFLLVLSFAFQVLCGDYDIRSTKGRGGRLSAIGRCPREYEGGVQCGELFLRLLTHGGTRAGRRRARDYCSPACRKAGGAGG
ncbi:MAG: hypothetical protein ACE5R4_06240 [Armatimonadota bacterium]